MNKLWIFTSVVVVAGVAGWEYRDRLPVLSTYLRQDKVQEAAHGKDADGNPGGGHRPPGQNRRGAGGAPPAVKTVAAVRRPLPMDVTAAGSASAFQNTTIAAQQAGTVASIAAADGAFVKQGDLIAKLDDRTVKAALDKDKAMLVRDQATLAQAETALARAADLLHGNAGTQQTFDQAKAARDTAAATLDGDRAAIAADEVAVDNTDIRAPFDGRLGDIGVSPGAYLSAGAAIVTIAQYDPIDVKFHLPQAYLEPLKRGMSEQAVTVDAAPQSGGAAANGKLNFFDNTVDQASGTILVKARFDNPSGTLWPGQSLNVTVHFEGDREEVVVPTVAVSPGLDSPFVFAVGEDHKVHVMPVKVGRSNGSDTAISSGLAEGVHVVVEGQSQLVEGAVVNEQLTNGDQVAQNRTGADPAKTGAAK